MSDQKLEMANEMIKKLIIMNNKKQEVINVSIEEIEMLRTCLSHLKDIVDVASTFNVDGLYYVTARVGARARDIRKAMGWDDKRIS